MLRLGSGCEACVAGRPQAAPPLAPVVPLLMTCSLAPRSARRQTANSLGSKRRRCDDPRNAAPYCPRAPTGRQSRRGSQPRLPLCGLFAQPYQGCRISPAHQERRPHVHIDLRQRESILPDRQGGQEKALRVQTAVVRQPTHASSGPAGDRFAVIQPQRPPAAQADQRYTAEQRLR